MDITIEKLIYGGDGLAHHEGSTVFVPFVLPAERVSAAPVEKKKKFIRARVEKLIEQSAGRAVPPCPHFGVCGGCNYQHIAYEAQLQYKTEILRETLRRLGHIEWPGEIAAHASPPWGYRNRAQWKVRPLEQSAANPSVTALSGQSQATSLRIGYFGASSATLCAVEQCAILSPLLLKTLLAFRDALAAGQFPRNLREIEAFAGANDSKLLLTLTFSGAFPPAKEIAEKVRGIAPELESLLLHDPTRERMDLAGPGFVQYEAGGSSYRVGHLSFFQVNRFLIDEMVGQIAGNEEGGSLALDLFAGVGLFSVPLAKRFDRIVSVESNPAAVRDLEFNISARAEPNRGAIEARAMDVEHLLDRFKDRPDLIVADPPRAGLSPGIVRHLARIKPARITYISCEPPTLARDLAELLKTGYEISAIHLLDLFPQTFHMEAVVLLRRIQ
ncbi:MAG TPA: 23S rRNA (uracil(1939)-C(5))-methyltransferase RlmD [Candidatus Acidoferrales bacterium]